MVLQAIGMAASIGGSLLQRSEQKQAQRKAREERERLQRMGEQRQQEVESDFESLIETRRMQAAAENPALQAARRTMVRQKQHAAQIRMRARQGGLTPEQLEAYTLGGEFEEYIGEKTARLAEISAGTEAIERLTQAKAQAGSDIFKSTQAATAPLLGEEARLRAAAAQSGMGAALGALGAGLSLASQYGGGGEEGGLGETDPLDPLDPANTVGSPSLKVQGEYIMPKLTEHLGIQVQSGGSIPTSAPGEAPYSPNLNFSDMAAGRKSRGGSSLDKFGAGSMVNPVKRRQSVPGSSLPPHLMLDAFLRRGINR